MTTKKGTRNEKTLRPDGGVKIKKEKNTKEKRVLLDPVLTAG